MDLKTLADRLGLEPDEFNELAELFVETETAEVKGLKAAVAAKDLETVAKMAHSLKGAAGNLGFLPIHESARDLEQIAHGGQLGRAAECLQEIEEQLASLQEQLAGS